MEREEWEGAARSSTEDWRTSEALQTIQRPFWVASHCCCGIGQSCTPMSCWKLRVANTEAARRLRGLQPGPSSANLNAHSPTRESGTPASLSNRRIYELRRDRTWKHW